MTVHARTGHKGVAEPATLRAMFSYITYMLGSALRFLVLVTAIQGRMDQEQPGVPHGPLARVCAWVAMEVAPERPERVAAILMAHARQESSFGLHRAGDSHRSWGTFQIFGRPDLEWDDLNGAREAWRQTLIGLEGCPRSPFSMYLSGRCITEGKVRRLADGRMKLAMNYERELR